MFSRVLGLAALVGWMGWQLTFLPGVHAGSPGADGAGVGKPVTGETVTNGVRVIPVKDADGRVRESMVLLPVQARTIPSSTLVEPRQTTGAGVSNIAAQAFRRGAATNGAASGPMTLDKVVEVQVGLVNHGISPGSIDGLLGAQTRAAVRAFQESQSLPATGNLDDATLALLAIDGPLYTNYVVMTEDVERLLPLSSTWLGKSQQPRLDYETLLELVAEKTFTHPNLLKRLNPSVSWTNAAVGTELKVPLSQYPEPAMKAALVRIRLGQRTLQVFGSESNLLAHFPCSIAQRVEKRPVGEALHVIAVAPDPNYTFDPAVFPESAEARELGRKLILQPGPNNPVGIVWIGLDKSGYGIHGTPRPEEVGRTESHGCFRLANWNARYLLQFVAVGTSVEVRP